MVKWLKGSFILGNLKWVLVWHLEIDKVPPRVDIFSITSSLKTCCFFKCMRNDGMLGWFWTGWVKRSERCKTSPMGKSLQGDNVSSYHCLHGWLHPILFRDGQTHLSPLAVIQQAALWIRGRVSAWNVRVIWLAIYFFSSLRIAAGFVDSPQ